MALELAVTEVKRSYDASGRREQARARRLAVVLAARDLFERDGFRPTTIAVIAAHAGVSAESIYKGFGTKAALAKAVFDLVLGRHLLRTGQLRSGIDLNEVRDVLWNYLAIDHYERLVLTQSWPLERYAQWLAHAIISAICVEQ
jgi:AcrR family transcriptional regulator